MRRRKKRRVGGRKRRVRERGGRGPLIDKKYEGKDDVTRPLRSSLRGHCPVRHRVRLVDRSATNSELCTCENRDISTSVVDGHTDDTDDLASTTAGHGSFQGCPSKSHDGMPTSERRE